MNKQWNHIIHDRLKDFSLKAPEGLLDDIKSEMLHRGLLAAPVSSKRRAFYYHAAAIAAVFLLLFGLGYQWSTRTDIPAVVLPTVAEIDEPAIASTDNKQESGHSDNSRILTAQSLPERRIFSISAITNDSIPTKEDKSSSIQEEQEETKPKKETPVRKKHTKTYPQHLLASNTKRKDASWAAGISFSGVIAQGNASSREKLLYESSVPVPDDEKPSISNPIEKERHHFPVRLGLSLRYDIHERWSILSGVTYSYLVSDFSKVSSYSARYTKQKLHYLGIPLQIGLQLWKSNRFHGYIAAGAQMEKLVSGKSVTNYSYRDTSTEKIRDKRLLFFGLASIGIEYALGKNISIYAEPNVQYYFKNGNGLKTHYNDKPLSFNITAGFRLYWRK